MTQRPISILIVDDHEVVRRGLAIFLNTHPDLRLVGEAETSAEALTLVQQLRPHVVLLDLRLPDASGISTCRLIADSHPDVRILVLSSHDDVTTIATVLQQGAHGYLLKNVRSEQLLEAIYAVAAGKGYLDPQICIPTLQWIGIRRKTGSKGDTTPSLSPKERQILPLLAEGKTNKEIAATLALSDKTVKNYLANIYDKIHVRRRTEAVTWYLRHSSLPPQARP